jgi:hypothetical protein
MTDKNRFTNLPKFSHRNYPNLPTSQLSANTLSATWTARQRTDKKQPSYTGAGMIKATASALCFAAVLLVLLLVNPVQAAVHPLDLHLMYADNPPERSLGVHDISSQDANNALRHRLTLVASQPTAIAALLVGYRAPVLEHHRFQNLDVKPSEDLRDEWNFMRRATSSPSALEHLAELFDVQEDDRPWATTTTVHILSSTDAAPGTLVPFATLAHEVDINEDFERIGIGAGAMIILGKNANIGAEIIQFGGGGNTASDRANDLFSTETRFLTRLQLSF